ncbi:MAG: hypothetical protein ACI9G9_000640 [Psychromonas sp.]|jgi:hypothetical protein
MHPDVSQFYLKSDEPLKSTFLALRDIIASFDDLINQEYKYRLPFFYRKGKMFCYLWKAKKYGFPYIDFLDGIQINHDKLIQGKR